MSLKVNYRSQELQWLARVGMFFAKRVFLVKTIKHLLHYVQKSKGAKVPLDPICRRLCPRHPYFAIMLYENYTQFLQP